MDVTKELPDLPRWVPDEVRHYLAHVSRGVPIRALARGAGVHPSTILRQVRRLEALRDDPLVDHALDRLDVPVANIRHEAAMNSQSNATISDDKLKQESRRVLRRLCERGAVLAVAEGLPKAVVVREGEGGNGTRTAVVDQPVAEAMALNQWIEGTTRGKVTRYRITSAGRAALSSMMAASENAAARGFAEVQIGFDGQPGQRAAAGLDMARLKSRFCAESPLLGLARRRDKDGKPFLDDSLVAAGERLREDFEISQMEPGTTQNWDHFLTAGVETTRRGSGGTFGAKDRVAAALADLGEGLADVALRCCCHLEGLETAEKKLGWSARSGKIVLRIALVRLREHYRRGMNGAGDYIG
ncbi:DUF6456 domain-containing protein [Shimia biformata]|uniref:DUF6456 domain-containing protein n=1 Tax=Shimia biformata TaxID=1294299 RepID=UPI001951CC94|nr:DUF6456 domain-containing protein [Shimia biformata]